MYDDTNLRGDGEGEIFLLGDFLGDRVMLRLLLRLLWSRTGQEGQDVTTLDWLVWRLRCVWASLIPKEYRKESASNLIWFLLINLISTWRPELYSPAYTTWPPGSAVAFGWRFRSSSPHILFLSLSKIINKMQRYLTRSPTVNACSTESFCTVNPPGSASRSPASVSGVGVSPAWAFGAPSASWTWSAPWSAPGSPATRHL